MKNYVAICLLSLMVSGCTKTLEPSMERMVDDGKMMKLPMEDGTKVRYCFAGEEDWDKLGKLVCMGCGRLIPLECSKMADFLEHIYKEHGFELDQKHTILYGYCECCNNKRSVPKIGL